MNKINIWENTIHQSNADTTVDVYITKNKTSDVAMIIFPGGGYRYREPLEAEPYAKFFNDNGITAFVWESVSSMKPIFASMPVE